MKKTAGFTLIEMIVSVFIVGIIGGIATEVIIKSFRNNNIVQAQSLVHRDISNALDRFTRVSRSATQVLQATTLNFKIRGYPDTDDIAPSEINFFVSNGSSIHYTVIPPTGTAPNYTYSQANAKEYILISKISPTTVTTPELAAFRFYDDSNVLLTSPVTIASIRSVEITIRALDQTGFLSSPITESTIVNLRNFKTNL